MTVLDLPLLAHRLCVNLGLPETHVRVAADDGGNVHVDLPELSGKLRRRACAVCRLTLGPEVLWTIREDDEM